MPRFRPDPGIPTLEAALTRHRTVAELKALASLLPEPAPTRKPELVEAIVRQLTGDGLRRVYERMDALQRAALAEVVHGTDTLFPGALFRAKYGKDPDWGKLGNSTGRARSTPPAASPCCRRSRSWPPSPSRRPTR